MGADSYEPNDSTASAVPFGSTINANLTVLDVDNYAFPTTLGCSVFHTCTVTFAIGVFSGLATYDVLKNGVPVASNVQTLFTTTTTSDATYTVRVHGGGGTQGARYQLNASYT